MLILEHAAACSFGNIKTHPRCGLELEDKLTKYILGLIYTDHHRDNVVLYSVE
ncbi:hypothetical protein HY612_01625 [Candidatus Roizmanbacteria bacterium]|nr:hypothetical protein [Candidatus Roizmanbacteria bacterium]